FPVAGLPGLQRAPKLRLDFDYLKPDAAHYFFDFFFIYYLYRHFGGMDLIRDLISSGLSGAASIDQALGRRKALEPDEFKRGFYGFRPALYNYQLALLANRYSA